MLAKKDVKFLLILCSLNIIIHIILCHSFEKAGASFPIILIALIGVVPILVYLGNKKEYLSLRCSIIFGLYILFFEVYIFFVGLVLSSISINILTNLYDIQSPNKPFVCE